MKDIKNTKDIKNPNDICRTHCITTDYGPPYYRKFAFCSDGSVVLGTGPTPESAEEVTLKEMRKREEFLALPDIERLKVLVAGDLQDTDKKDAIRIMAKMLIKKHEKGYF